MDKINQLFKLGTTGAQDLEQAELRAFQALQSETSKMTDQMLEDRLKKNTQSLKLFEKEAAELNKKIQKEGASDIPFILERTRLEKERLKPILEQLAVYRGENAAINEQIKLRNDNIAKTEKVTAEFLANQKKAADEQAKADKKTYESKLKILDLEKQQQILMAQIRGEKLGEFGAEKVFAEKVYNLKKEYSNKNIGISKEEVKVAELTSKQRAKAYEDAAEKEKIATKNGLEYLRTETDKNYKKGQDALDRDMKQRMDKTQAMHDLELERLKKHEENKQAAVQKSFELATTITDGAFGLYQANLNKEMTLLNKRYEEEVRLADGNKQRLTEIEQEKAAKEKEIRTKQFQAEQAAAVARVIFETASQVAKWASNPVTAPLAALTLAVQAAQIGFILAQPVPEFAEGTKGKPFKGGKAMVGERGVEKVVTESGKVYFTPATATLVDLPKGSQVIPNHALSKQEIYWGSMQSGRQAGNGSPVVGEIRELGSILKGLPITQLNMDERGFEKFIRTPRRTTKILNNRFRTEN
jgi:hypothetical protein